ncbi:MAG: hypothetical protein HAW63_05065 [Bdellovibrionaceae bacterium]|nr:hypothetical protein [Pseudobdellovibrionaceae bacterium]
MSTFVKYFFCLNVFFFFGVFSTIEVAAKPSLKAGGKAGEVGKVQLITVDTFKAWVKSVKNQLQEKKNTNKKKIALLNKFNHQLQAMKVGSAKLQAPKKKITKKKDAFLLDFQLASFQELFPLLISTTNFKRKTQNCVYLKQKLIYDLYPTQENITGNITESIRLPYAHKELQNLLKIICKQ